MKLKNTLKLSLVLASLPLVFAWIKTSADTIEPNNHPMGYFTQAQTSQAPFALPSDNQGLSRTNAPSDLTSNDGTLPRKDAVDIASYQSWMKQADFNQLKVQGIKTIVIKLTEGTTYTNPYAKSQISMAKAAGLNVAVYHFSTFGVHNTSQAAADAQAIAEAKYFASVAKADGLPSNTVMINDAEYTSGGAPLFDWTISSQKFVNQLKASGFSNGKHYTSASWAVDYTGYMEPRILGAKNMWIAQYLYGKPSASNLQNTKFGAWQYTSQMYFTNFSSHQPVDVSIDYSNFFTGAAVNPPAPSGFINVYRLYNTRNMEHLYTTNKVESDNLTSLPHTDWRYEGIAWQAPVSSSTPVYRVYNPKSGEHLNTKDSNEVKVLTSKYGWRNEGTSFFSDTASGARTAYRLFNPAAGVGAHFVTMDAHEKSVLMTKGWKYEGVAWYGKK